MSGVLPNYVVGSWQVAGGAGEALVDPTLGTEVARVSVDGVDFGRALAFAREVGGPALREATFAGRAGWLSSMAELLASKRAAYASIALANSGNTAADAAIDIDGAIATIKYFAKLGAALGERRLVREGEPARLGRDERFEGVHVAGARHGAAVHINAFNFPAWGLWEKAAVALLAGVPVVAKPAAATAWLAQAMVDDVVRAAVLPPGALSLLCAGDGELLDHVEGDDVIAFTGSAATGERVRGHRRVLSRGPRVNVEADSLNACVLGPDVTRESPEFGLFVAEVVREMTVKAGQKCTAIRRVIVPAAMVRAAGEAIAERLAKVVVGDPRRPEVTMGPLVNHAQQRALDEALSRLSAETEPVNDASSYEIRAEDPSVGAFAVPTLLRVMDADAARVVHEVEPFGPVATIVGYRDLGEAFSLVRRAGGALVASVVSADPAVVTRAVSELGPAVGRLLIVDASVAKGNTGHGMVLPSLVHGGPGRAGGGEELGAARGLWFYFQRTALQGPSERLRAICAEAASFAP